MTNVIVANHKTGGRSADALRDHSAQGAKSFAKVISKRCSKPSSANRKRGTKVNNHHPTILSLEGEADES
jgi:hypothetical protein